MAKGRNTKKIQSTPSLNHVTCRVPSSHSLNKGGNNGNLGPLIALDMNNLNNA